MKKRLLFFLTMVAIVCCFSSWTLAASKKILTKRDIPSIKSERFYTNQDIDQGTSFLKSLLGLNNNEDLQALRNNRLKNEKTFTRYQQLYMGIPVWGHQVITKRDKNGSLVDLRGEMVSGIQKDLPDIPKNLPLTLKDAVDMAKEDFESKYPSVSNWFYRNEKKSKVIYLDKTSKARLCYHVSFFVDSHDQANPARPLYMIDVYTGQILHFSNQLEFGEISGAGPGGNYKANRTAYDQDQPNTFLVNYYYYFGGKCSMDTGRVKTINLGNGTDGSKAYQYGCSQENPYNDFPGPLNGAYCPVNDAQYFGKIVYDMYHDYFSQSPFGGSEQIQLRVHYGNDFANAFWDGAYANFGDGNSILHPLVSLDVVAHEISHGFTEILGANLTGSGQSGAIEESFSDIAGEAAEYYEGVKYGLNTMCDYKFGYDIVKTEGTALRYLDNPTTDGVSIDSAKDYYNGMSKYAAAGVFNKAFYLLATTTGWNPGKAFKVFAYANMNYWTPNIDFINAAQGVYEAAVDLSSDLDLDDGDIHGIHNAFHAVDILVTGNYTYADFSYDTSFLTVSFTDKSGSPNSQIDVWQWDFGDGTKTNEVNPQHTYQDSGTYIVTLKITDNDGNTAQWWEQVTVSNTYCQSYSFDCNEEWISQIKIGNTSYTSGPSNYSDFTDKRFYLETKKTYNIELINEYCSGCSERNEFWNIWIDYNKDGDFEDDGEMVFYDYGKGMVSGQISIPASIHVEETRMRVHMTAGISDEPCGQFSLGEVEDYSIRFSPPKLEADFTYTSSGLQVDVTNKTYIPDYVMSVNWFWDFGDGTTSSLKNPSSHAYNKAGDYTITLTAVDADNSGHSSSKSIIVSVSGGDIEPGFEYTVESGTTVSFQNTTTIPAGADVISWEWNFGDGSEKSYEKNPPNHTFPDFGSYSVTLVAVDGDNVAHSITKEVGFYCKSSGTYLDEYISKIAVNKSGESTEIFSNPSGSSLYSDFTDQTIHLESGSAYDVELNVTYPDPSYQWEECWALWIDFNNNSFFSDAGEKVLNTCAVGNFTQTISIPQSVSGGAKRARLTMKWSDPPASPEPCGVFNLGEVEDYTVEITVPD